MKLRDIDSGYNYSIIDLYNDYIQFREEDPYNHAETFTIELYEILMATINGRNNMDVIGMTANETSNYIIKLRKKGI